MNKPPSGLSAETRRFWHAIVESWTLSEEGLELLRVACEARERMYRCDHALRREGLTIRTPKGGVRAHPATKIRRDAESTFLQALRAIGLES